MSYIHDKIITYDWIDDSYASDIMYCVRIVQPRFVVENENRRSCENRWTLSKWIFMTGYNKNESIVGTKCV